MNLRPTAVLFLFLSLGLPAYAATDTDPAAHDDGAGIHCLSLIRIRDSDVLDNQHIVFHTIGGKSFVNKLPRRCPGLSRNTPYMYRTSLNQLCDLDIITVLGVFGFGLTPQASCGLGLFHPIDQQGIDDLKQKASKP